MAIPFRPPWAPPPDPTTIIPPAQAPIQNPVQAPVGEPGQEGLYQRPNKWANFARWTNGQPSNRSGLTITDSPYGTMGLQQLLQQLVQQMSGQPAPPADDGLGDRTPEMSIQPYPAPVQQGFPLLQGLVNGATSPFAAPPNPGALTPAPTFEAMLKNMLLASSQPKGSAGGGFGGGAGGGGMNTIAPPPTPVSFGRGF